MDSKMKRRDFLKISALAGVAVVAAACSPTATPTAAPTVESKATAAATTAPKATTAATTAATAAPKATEVPKATAAPTKVGFQGEILFYASSYMPTSENPNPDPKAPKHEAMKTISQQWMAIHPGVILKFMQAPTGDYLSWITTQLIGGTGPDIFWHWLGPLGAMADQGQVVPLNDYLELPNKYTPDDKTSWMNTFKSPFQISYSIKGQFGGINLDMVATGVYCNVDMFKSVGIDLKKEIVPELGSPKDWDTMISWFKKFKEAGLFGFSMGLGDPGGWIQRILTDQLFWNLTPTFDKLNYHEGTSKLYQEGKVSREEMIMQYVCNNWKPFEEPGTRTEYELIKDLLQYMPAGFEGESILVSNANLDLFLQNKIAMIWEGTWNLGTIMQDDRRKFEFSSFWMPPLTKATTPLAKDPPILPIGVGGIGSSYGINHKCIAKGNIDECVDWLMYITTPENNESIVNEVPSYIPSNKKAKSLPEIENMFVGETRQGGGGFAWMPIPWWFAEVGSKFPDTFKREQDLYFLDEQDLDTFMAHMETAAQENLPEVIRAAAIQYSKDGSWDLTQWTCQPTV